MAAAFVLCAPRSGSTLLRCDPRRPPRGRVSSRGSGRAHCRDGRAPRQGDVRARNRRRRGAPALRRRRDAPPREHATRGLRQEPKQALLVRQDADDDHPRGRQGVLHLPGGAVLLPLSRMPQSRALVSRTIRLRVPIDRHCILRAEDAGEPRRGARSVLVQSHREGARIRGGPPDSMPARPLRRRGARAADDHATALRAPRPHILEGSARQDLRLSARRGDGRQQDSLHEEIEDSTGKGDVLPIARITPSTRARADALAARLGYPPIGTPAEGSRAPEIRRQVAEFFERELPRRLAARPELAYTMQSCRFVVKDGTLTESWHVDLMGAEPRVVAWNRAADVTFESRPR